ncbi:hypothetical protein [Calothrix sp. NIES-2098]|uniref:hypothetical protein n=1 Tax=Calothrix sp. NIES-2098 TaxID=1954171 RepID=UPI000B620685|nr:hypothetical protein NIES2098_34620 [Calothrix sp. NIES-2098]
MSEQLAIEVLEFVPKVLSGRITDIEVIKAELQKIYGLAIDAAAESVAPSLRIDP